MSEVMQALYKNDFILEEFIESPKDISDVHKHLEKLEYKLPLSMIILARKISFIQ